MKISKPETLCINWVRKHILALYICFIVVMSLGMRFVFRDFISVDAKNFLLPWYAKFAKKGIFALRKQIGDYNVAYQVCIALMTYLPIKPLYAYKILSCLFDYLLAGAAALIVCELIPQRKKLSGAIAFTVVLLSPIVVFNSAAWAQCDAIYGSLLLLSLYFLLKDRYTSSFLFFRSGVFL